MDILLVEGAKFECFALPEKVKEIGHRNTVYKLSRITSDPPTPDPPTPDWLQEYQLRDRFSAIGMAKIM